MVVAKLYEDYCPRMTTGARARSYQLFLPGQRYNRDAFAIDGRV